MFQYPKWFGEIDNTLPPPYYGESATVFFKKGVGGRNTPPYLVRVLAPLNLMQLTLNLGELGLQLSDASPDVVSVHPLTLSKCLHCTAHVGNLCSLLKQFGSSNVVHKIISVVLTRPRDPATRSPNCAGSWTDRTGRLCT